VSNRVGGLVLSGRRKARVGGFTLIELLTSLVIFLVVVSASYALFDGGRRLAARGEYHAKRFQSARAALRAIEADLKSVFMGGAYDAGFKAAQAGTDEAPLDTLEAVACNRPVLVTAEQARQVMEVYIAADLSAERSEPVNLPLPESRVSAAAAR